MKEAKTGSCLCNQVKYEVQGEFESFYLCHCKFCQKDTCSSHSANLFSANSDFKWLAGEDLVSTFNLPSTRHVKSFCSICGSALPSIQDNGNLLVIPAGSLDSKFSKMPDAHLFSGSKACWDVNLDKLNFFERLPE